MLMFGPTAQRINVLCLGAHPDDIEIGCGGTLLTLAARTDVEVHRLLLTGTPDRIDEAMNAAAAFGGGGTDTAGLPDGRLPAEWNVVKDFLEERAAALRAAGRAPDLIFAPRPDDAHQDHALVGSLVATVWRDAAVLHYEIPKWDGDFGPMTHYVPLSAELAEQKYQLLTRCYPSQVSRDWWDREMFLGLLRLRGMECRAQFAEAFRTTKMIIDLSDRNVRG
jgi:LmbE family N-acetylglucosaminyl deacetylase